jgi:hypothetical protein
MRVEAPPPGGPTRLGGTETVSLKRDRVLALRIPRAALFDAIPGELLSQRELNIDCSGYSHFLGAEL